MAAAPRATWLADPDAVACRVDAADLSLLQRWFGADELTVPAGTVAWVERAGAGGRVARPGDCEQGPFVAVVVRDGAVALQSPPIEVRTTEGFPAEARCVLDVAVDGVAPQGLRAFASHLFVSGPAFTRADLWLYLAPAVDAAWRALAAAAPARELCEGDVAGRFERELRDRLRRPCFEAGLELLAVRAARVTCAEWDAIRSEQVDATVASERERHRRALRESWLKERKNQALSQNELAEFYEALEHDGVVRSLDRERAKAQVELDLTRLRTEVERERAHGELRQLEDFLGALQGAGLRELFERYLDRLSGSGAARRLAAEGGLPAEAAELRTRRLLAVAGARLLAFDPAGQDGSGPAEVHDLASAGLGGLRSVRACAIDGQPFLVAGAQGGCVLLPVGDPGGPRALRFPDGARTRGGANSVAVAGGRLVATHSELGVVTWDLADPAAPAERVCVHRVDGARTVRGVQVVGDQCVFAAGSEVLAFHAPRFPEGTPTVYRGAGAPITALAVSRTHVFAGTAAGHVWRWALGEPDRPEAELPRGTAPVTMLRLAVVNGAPTLLAAATGYGIAAKPLHDDAVVQYHAEHPIRWATGAPDVVAGVDRDGHTLICWEPSRPKARWRRFRSDERMQDLWAWTVAAGASA